MQRTVTSSLLAYRVVWVRNARTEWFVDSGRYPMRVLDPYYSVVTFDPMRFLDPYYSVMTFELGDCWREAFS